MDIDNNIDTDSFLKDLNNIVRHYKKDKQRAEELNNLINISEEADISKQREIFYKKQLSQISKIPDNEGIFVKKYTKEKERNNKLEEELLNLAANIEELKSEFEKEKQTIKFEYETKLLKVKTELQTAKEEFQKRETALNDELQGVHSVAAVKFDEMETELKEQIAIQDNVLVERYRSANSMRMELMAAKRQMDKINSNLKSKQQECRILQSELNQLDEKFYRLRETKTADNNFNLAPKQIDFHLKEPKSNQIQMNTSNADTSQKFGDHTPIIFKYKPLEVTTLKKTNINKENQNKTFPQSILKTSKANQMKKTSFPPLIQVTNFFNPAAEEVQVRKKRKLHNINDLIDMEFYD